MFGIMFSAAEGASAGQSPFANYSFLILMGLTVVIFYFFLMRPQRKKEKERTDMISALKKGDRVLTVGGIYGIVDSFKDNDVVILKIGGTTKAEFSKSAIQSRVS